MADGKAARMTAPLTLKHEERELIPGETFEALLFDMDGTLLTSIGASERVWGRWARQFGLNARDFLPHCHGMRVAEVVASLRLPGVNPLHEAQLILEAELADVAGVEAIAGAPAFLSSLPPGRWAIVTSAPRVLALRRLAVAGLPIPATLITAEDVTAGKPDPACYLMAAARLGARAERCAVFEDAPAGIAAGEAAGCKVITVGQQHQPHAAQRRPSIRDYRQLTASI
jgi:sugar-phosphatase